MYTSYFFFTLLFTTQNAAVKVMKVHLPGAQLINSTVKIICQVDLENDDIYSLKWFFNSTEVMALVPSVSNVSKIFESPIAVSTRGCSWNELIVGPIDWMYSGVWLCEVYAEKTFQRATATATLNVIAPPTEAPFISGFKLSYRIHEMVSAVCTPPRAQPLPKLQWLINEQPAPIEYTDEVDGKYVKLLFPLQVYHLMSKLPKFSIRCVASFVFNQSLYQTYAEKTSKLAGNSSLRLNIYGLKNSFKLGDTLSLTCHYTGDDVVRMNWQVNYMVLPPSHTVTYASSKFLGIRMTIEPWHLDHRARIHVKCIARKIFKYHLNLAPPKAASLLLVIASVIASRS